MSLGIPNQRGNVMGTEQRVGEDAGWRESGKQSHINRNGLEVKERQSTHGKSEIALEESEICSRWESRSPMAEIVE